MKRKSIKIIQLSNAKYFSDSTVYAIQRHCPQQFTVMVDERNKLRSKHELWLS